MNPYIAGGAVLVIVVMGAMLKGAYTKNGELEVKLDRQALETQECADANGSNQATITLLEEQLADMVAQRRADEAERERILTERDRELEKARARADRLEREREDEVATNPDCADLTALSLDYFCPATAQQLRQRSIGEGGD